MNICIIIPAYNEAQTLGQLIEEIKARNLDALVIDDGSSDSSGDIAKKKGPAVLTHERKKGKGISLRDGFDYAIKNNYDGVITMDGDCQHDVADLDKFIAKAKESQSCVITGTRMRDYKGMPFVRFVVNKVMSAIISFLCRQKIPDTQCGFRYIGREVLEQIKLFSSDFEIESEVLVKASKGGFKVYSVPIRTIYHNESSKINPFIDTIRFFVYLIKEAWFSKS